MHNQAYWGVKVGQLEHPSKVTYLKEQMSKWEIKTKPYQTKPSKPNQKKPKETKLNQKKPNQTKPKQTRPTKPN